jgi:hypothetical protein
MDKITRISEFMDHLFIDLKTSQQASEIIQGILETRSPRISDIASRILGIEV